MEAQVGYRIFNFFHIRSVRVKYAIFTVIPMQTFMYLRCVSTQLNDICGPQGARAPVNKVQSKQQSR